MITHGSFSLIRLGSASIDRKKGVKKVVMKRLESLTKNCSHFFHKVHQAFFSDGSLDEQVFAQQVRIGHHYLP
jgi:hypothetical protein